MRYFKDTNQQIKAIDLGQDFLIQDDWQELTAEEIDAVLNPPKSADEIVAEFENAIEAYINAGAKSTGYNNIDSIAKYLANGNPFKVEAEALSIWTANVWVTAQTMLNEWQAGNIQQPTLDEVIAALPEAPKKGIDYGA